MRIPSGKLDQIIYFVGVDPTDLKTRETGLTTFTVYRSRNGGAATAYTTPTVTEISSANMPGVYSLLVDEDTTIAGTSDSEEYAVHITQGSMAPVTRSIELYRYPMTTGVSLVLQSNGRLGSNAVDAAAIAAGAITASKFAADAITSSVLAAASITNAKFASDAINASTIAASSITNAKFAVDAINSSTIAAGSITNAKFAADAINSSTIAASSITNAKFATGAIAATTFAADAISASVIAAATITNAKFAAGAISSTTFAAGAITATVIATDAIDADALATDAINEIWDLANGIETGLTPRGAMRLVASATAGKMSGGGTGTEIFRNAVADSKARITATVDASGNRSAILTDVT